jgi:hypothetical protein
VCSIGFVDGGWGFSEKESVMDFSKIGELVAENDHTGALVLGARLLGAKLLEKKLGLVACLQNLEGHMPPSLGEYQYGLYKKLLEFAKNELSVRDYNDFYSQY